MLKRLLMIITLGVGGSLNHFAWANPYPFTNTKNQIVGNSLIVRARHHDTLGDIGMRHHIGFHEMVEANQNIQPWRVSTGAQVLVPQRFLLPQPYTGIVINLAELRLYYYPADRQEVWTFPLGIGRVGWNTPTASAKIVRKKYKPVWNVPDSIRKFVQEAKGVLLPKKVYPGPENPLGNYAIYLSLHGYLIHGTNAPWSIGKRVSSGCIRMLPQDIETLFHMVDKGTPVKIINQPFKAGWQDNALYLEAHWPLSDEAGQMNYKYVIDQATKNRHAHIDWNLVDEIITERHGVPAIIGYAVS